MFVAAAVNRAAKVDRVDFLLFLLPYGNTFVSINRISFLSLSL